jgi:hypothetical protein
VSKPSKKKQKQEGSSVAGSLLLVEKWTHNVTVVARPSLWIPLSRDSENLPREKKVLSVKYVF